MIRAVLFDLDGTLLDTAPDLVASLNHVRRCEGLPDLPLADVARYASRGARGLIDAGYPDGPEDRRAERIETLLNHYTDNSWVETRPFDGVEDLLRRIEQASLRWGIVTNKVTALTTPIVRLAGWHGRAASVVCGDTTARAKPHPDPIYRACDELGVKPAEALFVGDDLRDLQAGVAAGSPVALANWGYGAGAVPSEWLQRVHCLDAARECWELLTTTRTHGGTRPPGRTDAPWTRHDN